MNLNLHSLANDAKHPAEVTPDEAGRLGAGAEDAMIPTFITDGDPATDLPVFVDTANIRSLYDWQPGESLDEAIARKKAQKG